MTRDRVVGAHGWKTRRNPGCELTGGGDEQAEQRDGGAVGGEHPPDECLLQLTAQLLQPFASHHTGFEDPDFDRRGELGDTVFGVSGDRVRCVGLERVSGGAYRCVR